MVEAIHNFRETEIGPIPVEWEVVRLGKVASLIMGQSPPSSTYNTDGEGLPFLQGKAEFGETYPTPVKWCSRPQKVAGRGDVLISVRAPVGDVNVARDDYCIGRGLAAINGNESLDNWFLFYLLISTKRRLEDRGTGSTFKSINKGVLQNFSIPLPTLFEQRRIAHVLGTIQRSIAAQYDLIAAAREVKRSLMQRLFTYGPGPEPAPTRETEIGEIPEHWEVVPLEKLTQKGGGSIQTGPFGSLLHASDYVESGYPVIMPKDLIDRGRIATHRIACIGEQDYQRLERYHLQVGDVLVARRGEIGRRGLVTEKESGWVCGTGCLRIRPGNLMNSAFVTQAFETGGLRDWLTANAVGTTMLNLSTRILSQLPFPRPPLGEQQEIAQALEITDHKIAAEEQHKAAFKALFKTMLHQLMTGRIRVQALSAGSST